MKQKWLVFTTMAKIFCIFRQCTQRYTYQLLAHHYWQASCALIFHSAFNHHNEKDFLYFLGKCKQLQGVLPHHYQQVFSHFFFWFYPPKQEWFFVFYKCKQIYGLLLHHYWQGFFALVFCFATSDEVKMILLKIGPPGLVVAFSQASKYSFMRDSYHQEYS